MNLEAVLDRLSGLPDQVKAEIATKAAVEISAAKFIPNPGPQTDAWLSDADVLLYGGEPGGGKTGLLCGLAMCEHHQSLLMRRNGVDLDGGGGVIEELLKLYGTRDGFSGKPPATLRTDDDRIITFGAASNVGDEQKFQGRARDLLGVDEATQFTESQIRFLMGWVRTTIEGQRTRTVLATNPPASAEGDWVIGMFRPWLDLTYSRPAKHGELRWFFTTDDGDIEADGPDDYIEKDGRKIEPLSRTFIPANLNDNPYIVKESYQKQLDNMPPEYKHIAEGNFMAVRKDHEFQTIPTAWIMDAEERWTPEPPAHAPMSAMGVDVAQGGDDRTVITARYDAWFDKPVITPGRETPTGNEVAGLIITHRRHGAAIVLDMGGGYGGGAKLRLEDSKVEPVIAFKGASGSVRRTEDKQYKFRNKRTEAYWRFREALDPGQDGGSPVALPSDPELRADLAAPRFKITGHGIELEPKDKVVDRLGRSPDKGDSMVMAWFGGPKLQTHGNEWRSAMGRSRGGQKTVVRGRRK